MCKINTLSLSNKYASVLSSVENVEKATIIGPTSDNWERTGEAENYNHPIFLEVVDEIKMESMEI